jgi:hypothetical protein
MDADLCKQMSEAVEDIKQLNTCLMGLGQVEGQWRVTPTSMLAEDLLRCDTNVLNLYDKSIKVVTSLLSAVEKLGDQVTTTDGSPAVSLPTPEEARNKLAAFFLSKPQTRTSPLPVYTGCRASGRRSVPPGQFICARWRDAFCLMIVVTQPSEGVCIAYSPTAQYRGRQQFVEPMQFEGNSWTPLPTVFPEKPQQRWEFARDTQVLALWKPADGEWTTEFYEAKVVSRPSDRANEEVRGYLLAFTEFGQAVIPEQYVVADASIWPK